LAPVGRQLRLHADDIKEAQKTYSPGIIITEISEGELKELKEKVENDRTF
jgi:hypothetical protein